MSCSILLTIFSIYLQSAIFDNFSTLFWKKVYEDDSFKDTMKVGIDYSKFPNSGLYGLAEVA